MQPAKQQAPDSPTSIQASADEHIAATQKTLLQSDDLTVPGIDKERELIIDGVVYDVSSFVKRHPGGSVIKFQLGADASDAFHAFHIRSKTARKMLKSLPSRPAPDGYAIDPLSADYAALRAELQAEGYFNVNLAHVTYRCVEIFAMYAAAVALVWAGWWWAGAVLGGIAQGRCGWLMHEGGHYSMTGVIWLDRQLQMFFYGLGCGMSGCYWRNQHNKHHATPQQLGKDPDLQTLPLLAFHKLIGKRGSSKFWLAWQAPLFFSGVITSLVAWGWQFAMHPRHALRVGNYTELGWMGLRYVLWHAAFGYLGFGGSARLYAAYVAVGSSYIFTNFAVSHTHKDVVPKDKHISWALYAANHTTNCENGPICNWCASRLERALSLSGDLARLPPAYRSPPSPAPSPSTPSDPRPAHLILPRPARPG